MARPKRKSPSLTKASERAVSLASIDPNLDLGNGKTLAGFKAKIAAGEAKLENYNMLLSSIDSELNDLEAAEKEIRALTESMLSGVGSKYGKDSNEYEMAGGTRTSERKRPKRKKKTA
jgi:hypothetical protein